MTITADDLGVLSDLATAFGILKDGSTDAGWFGDPASRLGSMLANDEQRDALVKFVDSVLDDGDVETDSQGTVWLPIIRHDDPALVVGLVIAPEASTVRVSLGVELTTADSSGPSARPATESRLELALFQTARGTGPTPDPVLLLGSPGGRIHLTTTIHIDGTTPAPGQFHLGSIAVDVDVPTSTDDGDPTVGLKLGALQLPGGTPQDIDLSTGNLDQLEHTVLQLVLGLVRGEAQSASGAFASLAALLGLGAGIPPLPVDQLATSGVRAITTWLSGVLAEPSTRAAWFAALAALVPGGAVAPGGDAVTVSVADADFTIGVRTASGPSGGLRVVPTLAARIGTGANHIEAVADLLEADLGGGPTRALPRLSLWAQLGRSAGGSEPLVLDLPAVDPAPAVRVEAVRVGVELDDSRRPVFVLAADRVQIGTHPYATLDLTSTDALMDAAGAALDGIVSGLLAQLGDVGQAVQLLLGLQPPAGQSGITTVSLGALAHDPLGAVAGYWHTQATSHPDAIAALLDVVRQVLGGDGTGPVLGDGTAVSPWRVRMSDGFELQVHLVDSELHVAAVGTTSVDSLGNRCTVIEGSLGLELATIDLAGGHASIMTALIGALTLRGRGLNPPRAVLDFGPFRLQADHVGVAVQWAAKGGLSFALEAPGLVAVVDADTQIPLALPTAGAVDDAALVTIEALVGALAPLGPSWLSAAVELLGWANANANAPRLALVDLVGTGADATAAVHAWLGAALVRVGPNGLAFLADLLSGAAGHGGGITGIGTEDQPFELSLTADGTGPTLLAWFPPAGPGIADPFGSRDLLNWQPGAGPLSIDTLVAGLQAGARTGADIADLTWNRDLAGGLSGLVARWTGGDGRIVPPISTPADTTVVVIPDVASSQLASQIGLDELVDHDPPATFHVRVVSVVAADTFVDATPEQIIDLTAANRAPESFLLPTPATGDWYIALGRRDACKLPTGDLDGTLGQAARLGRVLDAFAALGAGQVMVGHDGAGHAARAAAAAAPSVSDVVTFGTPYGPVSLTVLDEAGAGDAWRLLQNLLPPDGGDDPDLARGRALVAALAELDALADPAVELRVPATPIAERAGLSTHAVFGVSSESAVRTAITAVVVAGLATRASAQATDAPAAPATGVRLALHLSVGSAPTDSLVIGGDARIDLGGFDLGTSGVAAATDHGVRLRVRIGAKDGWLAGGPDPQRGPTRSREHALRALSADVRLPRGGGSTMAASAQITLLDGRVFDQAREQWAASASGEPVASEVRVLLSLAAQRIVAEATASSPAAVGLRDTLESLELLAADGSVADAVDQLLHDPSALVSQALADPTRRTTLAEGARALVGASAPQAGDGPMSVRVTAGPVTVVGDLDTRTLTLDVADGGGRFGWSAHLSATSTAKDWTVRLGADADHSPAGAFWVQLGPRAAILQWRPAGSTTTTDVALWPHLDANAAVDTLVKLTPALLGTSALEFLRRADETAQPIVDAALGAFGLLDDTPGTPHVRLPMGLLHDPAGWLRHAGALGGQPARLIALVDAVKPLLGLSGDPGALAIASGVTLSAHDNVGALELQAVVDTTKFTTPATTPLGRLAAGVTATIRIPASGPPQLSFDVFAGPAGADAGTGRHAAHVAIDNGLRVFLRPATGADVVIYPGGPGLGAAAAAAVDAANHALPFLLNTIAAQSGASLAGTVGSVVGAAGDVLALRDDSHQFTYEKLKAFTTDPAGSLEQASTTLTAEALGKLNDALADVLPSGVTVQHDNQSLQITAGPAVVRWQLNPFRVDVTVEATGLPAVDALTGSVGLTSAGLDALTVAVGPAPITAGPVELRPVLNVFAGASPAGGRRVELGLDVDGTHAAVAQWLLDAHTVQLAVLGDTVPVTDATAVAVAMAEAVASLAASLALTTDGVEHLLALSVGTKTVGELLHGVLLHDDGTLDTGAFATSGLLSRVARLLDNLAGADLAVSIDGTLTIGISKDAGGVVGVTLGLLQRLALVNSDVIIWLEEDDSWIDPVPSVAGVTLAMLQLDGDAVSFAPGITVSGIGIRIGRSNGQLLDLGLTLESVAVHAFVALSATQQSGGVQLQFTNLAVAVSGATGGNAIASGILADSGSSGQRPKPAFSPALAVQKHGADAIEVTLRAGDGDGPWWIAVQKGFGPLYIDKVGFGVTMPQHKVESISLLLDARVSLFGLNASVDDLSITYFVVKGDFFTADNWAVDLGGLAVSADIGALSISGGLLKSGSGDDIEYLGMLLGRFGVYGLTIYGGYGKTNGVVSFFAIGAVVGPIGGVPAFFVTGIGGGFGINRALVVPTDLSQFATYPLIKALDVSASAAPDPMQELRQLGTFFPPQQGNFWFAAGLSFTSFALVDGIAVVAIQFGDGFEFALLGLARMALPRPQFAIVSIELALVVRISSKEGVIWVQGQLTDNSYLLYPDVRLTGGFACVIWFAGPHRGEFVLTMGGFHPDFHRDGYPQVPRLGLQWQYGVIAVKGGAYFALTSEAVMAGVDVSVSADFGCAWARLSFGAHAIVFFDPFHLRVDVYVTVAAGITIDTWFGDITFSVSVGATLHVEGPDFHGTATVSVGPCDVTVPFGSDDDHSTPKLTAAQFIPKYLEEISPGVAQAISSIVSAGAVPPRPNASGATAEPPDGTQDRPFVVTAEFAMTVTTLVPATSVDVGAPVQVFNPTHALGIAPMGVAQIDPALTLRWQLDASVQPWPFGTPVPQPYGAFPLGVWGPPQPADAPKVPSGEVVQALSQVTMASGVTIAAGGPAIDYNRLDPPGPRRPLPFLRNSGTTRQTEVDAGEQLSKLVADATAGADTVVVADDWRRLAGASRTDLAAWIGDRRRVAPVLGSLGDRLAPLDDNVVPAIGAPVTPPSVDCTVHPPVALAVLSAGTPLEGMRAGSATTVSDSPQGNRVAPPAVASMKNVPAAARLVLADSAAQPAAATVVASHNPAVTRISRSVIAAVARTGADRSRVDGITAGFDPSSGNLGATASTPVVRAGEVVVLALPNARRDVAGEVPRPSLVVKGTPTRVVMQRHGGDVVLDTIVNGAALDVAQGVERVAVAPIGDGAPAASFAGWHAGMTLPYLGWGTALGIDATVKVEGDPLRRRADRYRAGWVEAAELVAGTATVTTRFSRSVDVVVVVIDDPSADAGRQLVVGLDGATQASDAAGNPAPPVVVVAGNRAIMAYRVEADPAAEKPTVVSVASGSGWSVVGILGGTGDPADVASALAGRGLDSSLGAASPPGQGETVVQWLPAPAPSPAPAAKKAAKAKKAGKTEKTKKAAPEKAGKKKASDAKKAAKKKAATKKQAPPRRRRN